ncbi:MAG: PD40 domain-containing protein [Deltaproteobacteria bacterium]|nr:PD40 domain-containing protein [Deltaproteobacteria bacterium]
MREHVTWVAVTVFLLGTPCLCGCVRGGFDPLTSVTADGLTDLPRDSTDSPEGSAIKPDFSPDALGPFGPPQLIAEFVDQNAECDDPTLTSDGLEIYFNKEIYANTEYQIFKSTRSSLLGPWTPPVQVMELSGVGESNPAITADGLTLYFSRGGTWDLWVTTRMTRSTTWSAPIELSHLNSETYKDLVGSVDGSHLFLWFSSDRLGSNDVHDLFLSTRATTADTWEAPAPVVELNTVATDERSAWSNAGATVLYFVSDREGGLGGLDVYRTQRASSTAPFDPPALIGELNSPDAEDDPWLSDDQRTIYFSSNRSGIGQLYKATR